MDVQASGALLGRECRSVGSLTKDPRPTFHHAHGFDEIDQGRAQPMTDPDQPATEEPEGAPDDTSNAVPKLGATEVLNRRAPPQTIPTVYGG